MFRIGHLGDTLVALPAFRAVREAYPRAHIAYLSNSDANNPHYVSARNVLPEQGLFDEWISYPGGTNLRTYFGLLRTLRAGSYEKLIYLMTRNRTPKQVDRDLMFFRMAGIKSVIGAKYLRENFLETEIPRPTPEVEPESDFLLDCLRHDGFPVSTPPPHADIGLSPDEKIIAKDWIFRHFEIRSGRRLIAVAPGSKWESKIWDESRFAAVVERLIAEWNVFPLIFGGPEDRDKGDRLIEHWKLGANAAGELNVREAGAALEHCDLYLGNDTGTMHLAASVGTPCVATFAAVDWIGRWKPFGSHNHIFRKRVECEGCHSPVCFNDHKCLDLIEIQEVYQACCDVLERQAAVNSDNALT